MDKPNEKPKRPSLKELASSISKLGKIETDNGPVFMRAPTVGDYESVRNAKLQDAEAGRRLIRLLLSEQPEPESRDGLSVEAFSQLDEAAVQQAFELLRKNRQDSQPGLESVEKLGASVNTHSWLFPGKYSEGMKTYSNFLRSDTLASIQKMLETSDQQAKAISKALGPSSDALASVMKPSLAMEEILKLQKTIIPPSLADSLGKFKALPEIEKVIPPLKPMRLSESPGFMGTKFDSEVLSQISKEQTRKAQRMDAAIDNTVDLLTKLMTNVQDLTTTFIGKVFPEWVNQLEQERQDAAVQAKQANTNIKLAFASVVVSCVISLAIAGFQYWQSGDAATSTARESAAMQAAAATRDMHRDELLSEQLRQTEALRSEIKGLVEVNREQAKSISMLMDRLTKERQAASATTKKPETR